MKTILAIPGELSSDWKKKLEAMLKEPTSRERAIRLCTLLEEAPRVVKTEEEFWTIAITGMLNYVDDRTYLHVRRLAREALAEENNLPEQVRHLYHIIS